MASRIKATSIRFKDKAAARLFKVGQPMWSPDNGKNWYRSAATEPPADGPGFVVTKVNTRLGTITIGAR